MTIALISVHLERDSSVQGKLNDGSLRIIMISHEMHPL